jgi:hypothetical protein
MQAEGIYRYVFGTQIERPTNRHADETESSMQGSRRSGFGREEGRRGSFCQEPARELSCVFMDSSKRRRSGR